MGVGLSRVYRNKQALMGVGVGEGEGHVSLYFGRIDEHLFQTCQRVLGEGISFPVGVRWGTFIGLCG